MALPFSINTTYAAGSQVKSADLNAIQTVIKDRHNRTIHFDPHGWGLGTNAQFGDEIAQIATGSFIAWLSLTPWLIAGDTIKQFTYRWFNGVTPTAGAITILLRRVSVTDDSAPVTINTFTDNTNTGGASAMRNVASALLNHVVLADNFYHLRMTIDATGANDGAGFRGASLVLGV